MNLCIEQLVRDLETENSFFGKLLNDLENKNLRTKIHLKKKHNLKKKSKPKKNE